MAGALPVQGQTNPVPPPGEGEACEDGASRVLGEYRIVREIGRGGMGIVYEAEQVPLNRKVALKILPLHFAFDTTTVKKFHREAEACSRQTHPNIVAIYAVGEHEGVHFIAQELVEGSRTVAHWLEDVRRSQGTPPGYFRTVAGLVAAVADALECAHASGVIHRDVKPSNILLAPDGAPKVSDFGLARIENALALSRSGGLAGTPFYMSPEQAARRPGGIDHRTDIFSLGVMLYELLALSLPFQGATSHEVLRAIVVHDPPDPRKVNPCVPRDLAAICLRALEKDPEQRYATMAAFGDDLRRYLSGDVILAKPPLALTRVWRRVRRNAALSAALAVAVLAVAGLFVAVPWYRMQVAQKEKQAAAQHRAAEDWREEVARLSPLADAQELQLMEHEAAELWPASPDNAAAMRAWLSRAEKLSRRFEAHAARLAELRTKALPYDAAAQRRNRETHPHARQLAERLELAERLKTEIARMEAELPPGADAGAADGPTQEALREGVAAQQERLQQIADKIARNEEQVSARHLWEFAEQDEQRVHDALAYLVANFAAFAERPYGTIARVAARRSVAEAAVAGACGQAWEQAIAAISDLAACPCYGGLRIDPQPGLVPLGRDPRTGLFEFADLHTGQPPRRREDGGLTFAEESGLVLVLLPGGTFRMGAMPPTKESPEGSPNVVPWAYDREGPVQAVTIQPFLLSKFEMTQGQWLRVTGANPSQYGPEEWFGDKRHNLTHPVENVTWRAASELLGQLGLRLPSEAEWEYAARAGTATIWWTGDDPLSLQGAVNLADRFCRLHGPLSWMTFKDWLDDGYARHAPVDCYVPNPFGLFGIGGNVMEWCQDNWLENYRGAPADGSAVETDGARIRVARDGCWAFSHVYSHTSYRNFAGDTNPFVYIGVRPARSIERTR